MEINVLKQKEMFLKKLLKFAKIKVQIFRYKLYDLLKVKRLRLI